MIFSVSTVFFIFSIREEAEEFAKEHNLTFLETSAKTGDNVEEAFLQTAQSIYQKIQDGGIDLNLPDSGVQAKPTPGAKPAGVPDLSRPAGADAAVGGCCK